MTAPLIQPHVVAVLTDPDALEGFLVEAGGLLPRDAERVAGALTQLINESGPGSLFDQDWDDDGQD